MSAKIPDSKHKASPAFVVVTSLLHVEKKRSNLFKRLSRLRSFLSRFLKRQTGEAIRIEAHLTKMRDDWYQKRERFPRI